VSGRFVLICGAFALFAHPAYARDPAHEDCAQGHDLDRSIAGCTETLARGKREPAQNRVATYSNRGNAYNGKHEYDRAIADYNEAIRLNPKHDNAYVGRGNSYNGKREYDHAIADYNEAIRLNPNFILAYNGRGNSYNGKREYDRAIADYNEAIRLNPNFILAYNGRGNSYNGKREYDRAIADYNEAIRLDPKFASAYSNRGSAYSGKHEYGRAFADFDKAIGLDPKLAPAYGSRGGAYAEKGDFDRAIADFDKAIGLDPKSAPAYGSRGGAYAEKGDFDRAIADFDEAIGLDPKFAPAYTGRGAAYENKGDLDGAIADLDKAIGLDPKLAPAYGSLGTVYSLKGDLDRAIADYKKALGCDETVLICHVQNNGGGANQAFRSIADYIYSKGMTMVVDGRCASACVLLAEELLWKDPRPGILPSVCVTTNVDFRFHQTYQLKDPKGPVAEWNVVYRGTGRHNPAVQRWLDANGGNPQALLSKDSRRMPAEVATAIWPQCKIENNKLVWTGGAPVAAPNGASAGQTGKPPQVRVIITRSLSDTNRPTEDVKQITLGTPKIYVHSDWFGLTLGKEYAYHVDILDGNGTPVYSDDRRFTSNGTSIQIWTLYNLKNGVDHAGVWVFHLSLGERKTEGRLTVNADPGAPAALARPARAELDLASSQDPSKVDHSYSGTVVWRVDKIVGEPSKPFVSAVRGDVDLVTARLKVAILFKKNFDVRLSASHIINVSFEIAPGSEVKGVRTIGPILIRRPAPWAAETLTEITVISENNFVVRLMRGAEPRNIDAFRNFKVLDLIVQLTDGRAATISLEKGPDGARIFADAIEAWARP
jgi:tetratricopeptide (TPR) repeat protein